ncbi:hypothetical protein D9M68_360370 [compost metagenome]
MSPAANTIPKSNNKTTHLGRYPKFLKLKFNFSADIAVNKSDLKDFLSNSFNFYFFNLGEILIVRLLLGKVM